MILCVNANAAIDKTVVVSPLRLGEIHRPQGVRAVAGGKGANVARALRRLGATPVVTGWVGGFNGLFIEAGLQREGIATAFIQTDVESRTCLSILDPAANSLTEIYEVGDSLPTDRVDAFRDWLRANIAYYEAVTLSGSLPPDVSTGFYGEVLQIAQTAGVPGYLDSSGDALKQGLAGGPALIKPNAEEFSALVGRPLDGIAEIGAAASAIARTYATVVVVSVGAAGVIAARDDEVWQVKPPSVTVKSAVGSGDCTLAGLVAVLTRGGTLLEALRYGVAAGTANALSVGAGEFSLTDFEWVLEQTKLTGLTGFTGLKT